MRTNVSARRKVALQVVAGVATALFTGLIISSIEISRHLPDLVRGWLSRQYNGSVQIGDFHVTTNFLQLEFQADHVAVLFQGREDLPPVIAMRKLTLSTSVPGLLHIPARIHSVVIDGLQINVPPRTGARDAQGARSFMRRSRQVRFDEIRADRAVLKILPHDPQKAPHEFDIGELQLFSTGPDGALAFHAHLKNPSPPGEITSSGVFGPWNVEKPSLTPVRGSYLFANANLGVFNGIAGILSSEGKYQGVLERIEVGGTTDTPDFQVTRAGNAVDLKTTFAATVDGTDGNTYLHPVVSRFEKTVLVAQGKIERTPGKPGRTVTLEVTIDQGRIEDLLTLTVRGRPPMTGPVQLKTAFVVSPGRENILDRLGLDSAFVMHSMHFTDPAAQQRVDNMSVRSEGRPQDVKSPQEVTSTDDVAAAVSGKFRLAKGTVTLSAVQFQIPGAQIQISGAYALAGEDLDLRGKLKMQAPLSRTTTGIKSVLLRIADPFFSKDGHTELPIKVTGSVNHPHYALDLHRKPEKIADSSK